MAGSYNRVLLIGNLGADPEVRHTQDGKSICNIRLATTDTWRDKGTGERREKVEWHSVVVFNEQLAKVAQQYLKKGSKILVEGSLQTRKWQDNAGNDRYTTEVILQNYNGQLTMLDGAAQGNSEPQEQRSSPKREFRGRQSHEGSYAPSKSFEKDLDDEIPFVPEFR